MGELSTSRKALPYPKPQGLVSAGPADLQELGKAWEEVNEGLGDFMNQGVIPTQGEGLFGWESLASLTCNSNGELITTEAFGGAAYVPDPIVPGALMRVNTFGGPSPTNLSVLAPLKPSVLPKPGFQAIIVLEAVGNGWDRPPTYATNTGEERLIGQGNATPEPVAGRLQLAWVQVKNEGGVFAPAGAGFVMSFPQIPVRLDQFNAGPSSPGENQESGRTSVRVWRARLSEIAITFRTTGAEGATVAVLLGTRSDYLEGLPGGGISKIIAQELTVPAPTENEGKITTMLVLPAGYAFGWKKLSGGAVTCEFSNLNH